MRPSTMEMQRERTAIGGVFGVSRNGTAASGETLVDAASEVRWRGLAHA
jgi:hypothetical protein